MFHILRKIRKSLIGSNSMVKYLYYAFGEIVLVVIGILIALQINNWNQHRQARIVENELLHKLHENLILDTMVLDQAIVAYGKMLKNIETCFDIMDKPGLLAPTDLTPFINLNWTVFDFTINRSTYNEMINTGRLYSLRNKSLGDSIRMFFGSFETSMDFFRRDDLTYEMYMKNHNYDYLFSIINRIITNRNVDDIDLTWMSNPNTEEYQKLETLLSYSKGKFQQSRQKINRLKINCKKLIADLKYELH